MKKLLVLGAGFLQDFVIKKAVSMGYETFALDSNPEAVGFATAHKHAVINIVDEQACLEYAQKEEIDGVVTVATDFGVLSAAYVAEHMDLPGLNYDVAKLIKNKYRVRKCLYENRADDMEQSYEVGDVCDTVELAEKLTYPVIVKPCDGSGSRGTSRVDKAENLASACLLALKESITHKAQIESFIAGNEYGAESIVIDGEINVLAIMKKRMTKPPFYAELGHTVPCGLKTDVEQKAKHCVYQAIKALGINFGAVNMDFIISNDNKIHIIDVGARMGGNLIGSCIIPYSTGFDYMGAIIRSAVGDRVEWGRKETKAVATNILAFDEGTVKIVPDMELIARRYNCEIYHHMNNGMHTNKYRTNLDGCGYVVAVGETPQEAEKRAGAAFEAIKREAF